MLAELERRGREKLVTAAMIGQFADLTGNHQWIHEPDASGGLYGRQVAHGLLLISLIPGLLPDDCKPKEGEVQVVRGFDNLRLPSPVYPGDRVHVRVRDLKTYPAPSGKGTIVDRNVEVWSKQGTMPAATCVLRLQYI
jgi:acyl dehydratase